MNAVTMMLEMMGLKPDDIIKQVQTIGTAATEIRDAQLRIEAKLDALLAYQNPPVSQPEENTNRSLTNG